MDALKSAPRASQSPRRGAVWIPPNRGDAKGNVDDAPSEEKRKSAVAVTFRSKEGQLLGASALIINGVMETPTMAAISCREAICLAKDIDLNSMTIASYCSGVVRSILDGSLGENGMIIREVRDLKLSFSKLIFKFESRVSNGDAHNLTKFSLHLAPVWFLEPPGFVKLSIID